MENLFARASWLWLAGEETQPNTYGCFRTEFNLSANRREWEHATLCLSADSNFTVFVNGQHCPGGQFSDYPTEKTYSSLPVNTLLHPGRNVLAIYIHYIGEDFSTGLRGLPGIIAVLHNDGHVLEVSGAHWRAVKDPAFQSGPMPKVTVQLGYTFACDANQTQPWQQPDFDASAWPEAKIQDFNAYRPTLKPRPVAQLRELPRPEVRLVQHGVLSRPNESGTPAENCMRDFLRPLPIAAAFTRESLPPVATDYRSTYLSLLPESPMLEFRPLSEQPDANGYYLIVDLGREYAGHLELTIDAAAGTVVDIAHGEHLDDGRVRAAMGGRNFADRYICKAGINHFSYRFRRLGCRYLELHLTRIAGPVKTGYIGLVPLELPLPKKAHFQTDDRLTELVHRVAIDTLKLCMHEHYEDCPWREQALYAYDSRNQALYGYYLWGNYDFAATSFDLLGRGRMRDGYLELTAPGQAPITIPVFTFVWVTELYEHFLHSGSLALFRRFRDTVGTIIAQALSRRDSRNGLYNAAVGKHIWNFAEWVPGLDGSDAFPQAQYNLYLYEALQSAALMYEADGDANQAMELRRVADELGTQTEAYFWDAAARCYSTSGKDGKLAGHHAHIQALMLYNKLVPAEKIETVLASLCSGILTGLTFSAMPYLLRALMRINPATRKQAEKMLHDSFIPPILSGATSLWETPSGGADFDAAGSLCHAWSSLPAYYANAYVLGIQPLSPGFRNFRIRPYPGSLLFASGTVPTPAGDIHIAWEYDHGGLTVKADGPAELVPHAAAWEEFPISCCEYNGHMI